MLDQARACRALDTDGASEDSQTFASEAIGDDGAQIFDTVAKAGQNDWTLARVRQTKGERRVEASASRQLVRAGDCAERELHVERLRALPRGTLFSESARDELLHVGRKRGAVEKNERAAVGESEGRRERVAPALELVLSSARGVDEDQGAGPTRSCEVGPSQVRNRVHSTGGHDSDRSAARCTPLERFERHP